LLKRGTVRISSRDGITTVASWKKDANHFRGTIECRVIEGALVLINELPMEDYMAGLAEEPDTEAFEKQRAFAIAARSYAAHYTESSNRKFPGMPYDGDDSPARFQQYGGLVFEEQNPEWVRAVRDTSGLVLRKNGQVLKAAYFSSDDGRTRSPEENGWNGFPFAEVFTSKPDPWCSGMELRGHGVGMSGCGAKGQAEEGKTAEEILRYYYPGTVLEK
jgi:peptidoglycan hydrolase-like amidase